MIQLTSQALANSIRELRHGPWISPPSEVTPGQRIVLPMIPDTPDVLTPEEIAEYRAKKAAQKAAAKDAPVSSFQQMFQPIYDNPLILPVSELDKKWAAYLKTRSKPEGYPLRCITRSMHGLRRNFRRYFYRSNPPMIFRRYMRHIRRYNRNRYNRRRMVRNTNAVPSKGQEILRNFHREYLEEYNAAKEKKPKPERPQRNAFSGLSEEIKSYYGHRGDPLKHIPPTRRMFYWQTFFRTWTEYGMRPDVLSTLNVKLPYAPSIDEIIAAEKRNQPATPDVDRVLMPPPASTLPPQPADPAAERSFHCTAPDCTKSYKHLQGLRAHFKQQHPNLPVPNREQFKHILSNPKDKVDGGNAQANANRKSSVVRPVSGVRTTTTKRVSRSPKSDVSMTSPPMPQQVGQRPQLMRQNPIRHPRVIQRPQLSRPQMIQITDPAAMQIGHVAPMVVEQPAAVEEPEPEVAPPEAVSQAPPQPTETQPTPQQTVPPAEPMEVDSPAAASSVHARDSPAVTSSNESTPASSQSTAIPEPATPSQVTTPAAQLPTSSPASTTPKAKAQPKQKIKCVYCTKMYAANSTYQKHLRDVHPAEIGPSSGMQNVIYQPEIFVPVVMDQPQQNIIYLSQQAPQGTSQDPIEIDLTNDNDNNDGRRGIGNTAANDPSCGNRYQRYNVYTHRGQHVTFIDQNLTPITFNGGNIPQILDALLGDKPMRPGQQTSVEKPMMCILNVANSTNPGQSNNRTVFMSQNVTNMAHPRLATAPISRPTIQPISQSVGAARQTAAVHVTVQQQPDGSYIQVPPPMASNARTSNLRVFNVRPSTPAHESGISSSDDTDTTYSSPPQLVPQQTVSQQQGHRPHVRFVQNAGPRRNVVKINPSMPRPNTVRYASNPLISYTLGGGVTYRPTGQTVNPVRVVAAGKQGQGPRQFIPQTVRGGMPVNLRPIPYGSRGVRPPIPVVTPSMSGGGPNVVYGRNIIGKKPSLAPRVAQAVRPSTRPNIGTARLPGAPAMRVTIGQRPPVPTTSTAIPTPAQPSAPVVPVVTEQTTQPPSTVSVPPPSTSTA